MASSSTSMYGYLPPIPRRFGERIEELFPPQGQTELPPGSTNIDLIHTGKAIPAFDHVQMANSADIGHFFIDHLEAQNPAGNPRSYAGGNRTMFYLEDGTRTGDRVFNDVIQGYSLGDAGGASGFITAGTKTLIVGFGNSGAVGNATRKLTTDTAPWQVNTGPTIAQFWSIVQSGQHLYAVTNAGVTTLGEYHVSLCPAGNDPTLVTGWGGGIAVGGPEWPVLRLAQLEDTVVAAKADGLWYYDLTMRRFRNVLSFISPHPLNGKALHVVPNGVLYDTADGKLWFFDGTSAVEWTPFANMALARDVKQGRISAITTNGEYIAAALECWQNTTQGMGLKVITYIGGVFTDVTASVTDGSLTTGAAMAGWGASVNDALYIGSTSPFEAAVVRVTRNANAAVQGFATPGYSNGTTGVTGPFGTSFTPFTAGVDGSVLGTANVSLALTGYPPGASNAVLTWTDINAGAVMASTQLQFGGAIGNLTRYWARWTPATTTGMTNPTTIDEVEIVPSRTGFPNGGLFTATTNFSPRDRSGGCTHIYIGKPHGVAAITWFDVYTLHTLGGVTALGWTTGRPGVLGNGGQNLVVWGRYKQMLVLDGFFRDPSRQYVPRLRQVDTVGPAPVLALGPTELTDNLAEKYISSVYVDGDFIQNVDQIEIFMQWGNSLDIKSLGVFDGGPVTARVPELTGKGRKLYLWVAYKDANQTDIVGPYLTHVSVRYEYVDREGAFPQDRPLLTPETT